MDGSDKLFPRDSLSNLIGKRLEEILPKRSGLEEQYMPMVSQLNAHGTRRRGSDVAVRRRYFDSLPSQRYAKETLPW